MIFGVDSATGGPRLRYYRREAANRNAQRRAALQELSASLRESLAVLDDAKKMQGRRRAKPSWFKGPSYAERLAQTPGVVRG